MAKKAAAGSGSLRKRPNGTWEARFVVGIDPATGKTIRKSVYAKTQKEARLKMRQAVAQVDRGDYFEPAKITVSTWLDTWLCEFNKDVRESTLNCYSGIVKKHLKPAFGALPLSKLTTIHIQKLINEVSNTLAANTVHGIYNVCNKSMSKAVQIGYIRANPCDGCELPRVEQLKLNPLVDDKLKAFLQQIEGTRLEYYYLVDIFTGMREAELLALQWNDIDWDRQIITIERQLRKNRETKEWEFTPTKSGKTRRICPAPEVFRILKDQHRRQMEWQLQAGELWENPYELVFTGPLGDHLTDSMVYREFKQAVVAIGSPTSRLHDLRHSYAVLSLQNGDDPKTVQENLGHATANFTLNVYGHVSDQMRRDSARRMEAFIQELKTEKG